MTNSKTIDSFTFTNLGTGSFVTTLCYNDVEGTPQTDYSSAQVIVNRLGLYIENNGTYYYPYRLESQTTNAVMKTSSSYNQSFIYDWDNTQKILIPSGLSGTVNIYVKKMNTLNGDQKYILLISNNFENVNNNMGDITVDDITMTGNIIKNDSNLQLTLNNNNALRIKNSNGNVLIGPVNTSFCHFTTDRPKYYFNKSLEIDGSFNSYRRDLQLNPSGSILNGMIIKNNTGYVGIKTQNPTQALHVNGYVKATGYFNFAGLHESYFTPLHI